MIGMVATLRVDAAKAELFEDAYRDLMDLVRAEEPGCLIYQLTKSRSEANVYKVLELYADQAALTAHGDHVTILDAFTRMRACLTARPEIEYLDGVV
jgi:quinol monooxygenase YgiN